MEMDSVSFKAIMAYWAGTDDYAPRVANLTQGISVALMDATTIHGNGGRNTLSGHNNGTADQNLYFGTKDLGDNADNTSEETFVPV